MAHDPNFKDDTGVLIVVIGLVVFLGMAALPGTMALVKLFG
ncbi:hypothetical protein [Halomonas sp. 328]|nr:hypothetical protein [Halomonas sp. 328]